VVGAGGASAVNDQQKMVVLGTNYRCLALKFGGRVLCHFPYHALVEQSCISLLIRLAEAGERATAMTMVSTSNGSLLSYYL